MKPVIIAVGGGSASGKTTVVNEIIEKLNQEDLVVIKHDDYYKKQSHLSLDERYQINYDHPDSMDNDLFISDNTNNNNTPKAIILLIHALITPLK